MLDLVAVLLALGLLMYLAYRGVTLLILAPAMALLAALLTGGLPILGAYTQIFMTNTGAFIVSFFPLFMLGAIFGKLMDDTGSAKSLAGSVSAWLGPERAIVSVVLCCAVLTYGGVSAFVVAFAIIPVAAALFRAADIPKRLMPGALALGAFTFTMSALPGSPAIQNAIPMPFLGTTAFAAPGLGIITGLVMLLLGLAWLNRRAARARAAGEGYGAHADGVPGPDVAMREHAYTKSAELYRSVDAIRTHRTPPYPSTHNLGTARMSARPEDGVVDGWGRAHDVPNLFVSDGSVFTTGAAANPTLTIVALAIRQAEHIAESLRAGTV